MIFAGTLVLAGLTATSRGWTADGSAQKVAEREGLELFERRIRPLLVEHCYPCHSAKSDPVQGRLRLDTREGLLKGGDSGPAVAVEDWEASLLLSAIRYEDFEMPPEGPLPARAIADVARWLELGSPDPRSENLNQAGSGTEPPLAAAESGLPRAAGGEIDWTAARQAWAYQPPRASEPPAGDLAAVEQHAAESPVGRIDAFVLARLVAAGLAPNPPADRRTLIRRVSFDLTGLPPTPEAIERFVADPRPDAYERLVDRLLTSPAYAEHATRRWMDIARYAEDQAHIVGNNRELVYPNAYLYRDWLIGAFAEDLPYDEFIRLQLAADLLAPQDEQAQAALGFMGLGPKYYRRRTPEVMADEWEDRVDTLGRGLLGLTIACARCHDHKFDPISTEDYYALAGVFASTEMFNRPLSADVETDDQGQAKTPDEAMHVLREASPTNLHVMIRGDVNRRGQLVTRRFLSVLSDSPQPLTEGSGRGQLADAIADPNNPLTARVMANRVWQGLFGRGLVATPSNFGALGEPPSHPELLDDLAARWMEAGWSLKWLHREIVLSATYRRSSEVAAAAAEIDPQNRLLWRVPRRRLSVEQWRDAILASTGRLDRRIGGPSVQPEDPEHGRRTVYSEINRLDLNDFLSRFGHPDPNAHSGRRNETTTPLQKLFVLNSPFMIRQAQFLARDIFGDGEQRALVGSDQGSTESPLDRVYLRLYGRLPMPEERKLAAEYLSEGGVTAQEAFAHALLAANELLFLD